MTRPNINVTPLIDVLLVLLIIFMVVAPLKPSSFKARVPSEPKMTYVAVNIHTPCRNGCRAISSLRLNNESESGNGRRHRHN